MRSSRKLGLLPKDWLSPVVLGFCAWMVFPSAAAHADLAGLLAGLDRGGDNWRMVLTNSPAGSIHQGELAFADADSARLDDGAGMTLPDGRRIALSTGGKGSDPRPDEDRVNRRDKKGRIVSVLPMQPPKDFSAGSIMERQSLLEPSSSSMQSMALAFVVPKASLPSAEVASAFEKPLPPRPAYVVPPYLASLVTNENADSLALGYASPDQAGGKPSPFDSILAAGQASDEGRFVPQIGPRDHAWAATILPASAFSPDEQQCLATGIYFEARGESLKGQAAVAQVILNRVRNPAYPKTICGVVYQNEDRVDGCQFSFACDRIKDKVNSTRHWQIARQVAMAVTSGKIWLPQIGSATHYHAVYVHPRWADEMEKVGRIGMHIFYRTYGGGWS